MVCGDPGGTKCAGTQDASAAGLMALSESFFQASCSWQSEGLFGQTFSVALPIQALRGLPCLGSFSVVWCVRHMEGPPCLGSYSVDRCQALNWAPWVGSYFVVHGIRDLMGQPLYCSAANAGMWEERGYGDGSTPTRDSAVSLCFHDCLAFLNRHFPPQSPPSHFLNPSLHSQ